MDLDTNAKKFNYTLAYKIICVVLCLITALSACLITTAGVFAVDFRRSEGDKKITDWTQTSEFQSNLNQGSVLIDETLILGRDNELKNLLKAQKKSVVDKAYKKVLEYLSEYYPAYTDNTVIDSSTDFSFKQFSTDINTGVFESATFCVNFYIFDGHTVGEIYSDIENLYDSFVKVSNSSVEKYWADKILHLEYYGVRDGKMINANITDERVKNIKNEQMYFVIRDGRITDSKGIAKSSLSSFIKSSNVASVADKSYELYVIVNPDGNNAIAFYKDKFDVITYTNAHFNQLLIIDILCIISSFALAFSYFNVAGKKRKYDFVKLRFIDYVPFEVQAAAIGCIGFGVTLLYYQLFEWGNLFAWSNNVQSFQATAIGFTVLCFICWLLLFELCSSTARFAHSDKKLYKHFLTYWIFYGLFIASKFICKKAVSAFKKMKASAKRTGGIFGYKPGTMKSKIIGLTALWFIVNIGLMIFIFWTYFVAGFIGIVLTIGFIIGNFFVIRKACEYIKYLDMIITACSLKQDIDIDLEKLPDSLMVLAQSMKYTNEELQQAIAKAVKDERLRTQLITNVSHDLKTPLTSIITYVDLLSNCGITDEKANEYIGVLNAKGSKLKRLIDDLIEASKLTTGNVVVNASPMNLSELCLQATVDAQSDFEKAGLDLIVKQGDTPITAFADGAKTFRVIENLLSNARKYSAKSSRVYVSVYDENGKSVFEIKNISALPLDISPDELTERFVRGDESRNVDGNGLGLSIAKELCKAQNGKLDIIIDGDLFKVKVILPKS